MLVGEYKGKKVQEVKKLIQKKMIDAVNDFIIKFLQLYFYI